jgi:hypothetical protein
VTPRELADLYLEQMHAHREGVPPARTEPNALFAWEALISRDPEQAWPIFEHVLARISDDDRLEQVWYRLRLLLHRHYDAFHGRVAQLLTRFQRLAAIAGPNATDPEQYTEQPLDREALIDGYRAMHRTHDSSHEVDRLAHSDPERALAIALEIIHRGAARGWDSFDLMSPLADLLATHGDKVIGQIEEQARESVALRRVLWRLKRQRPGQIDEEVRDRMERAMGATTGYTELDVPSPPAQPQLDADEQIIEGWFEHEKNFWAFSTMSDLVDEDPPLAWSITLDLIARADDLNEIGAIAAGPLEELIRKHPDLLWDDLVAKAHTDQRFLSALRGVWVFETDGDVYHRFQELMETIDLEPN